MSLTCTNETHQEPSVATALDAWRSRVQKFPTHPAVAYFDSVLTAREVDDLSDALAVALGEWGVSRGDRVGIYLQNVPQYAVILLGLWKIGAAALVLNPMYRGNELGRLLDDAEPVGIICEDGSIAAVTEALHGRNVRFSISTSSLDFQTRNDPRVFESTARTAPAADGDLVALLARFRGRRPPRIELGGDDLALLTYTSGTTGPPKGALNSHTNVLATALDFGDHAGIVDGDVVFAVAPLFHITGAVLNAAVALVRDCTLVFANRFNAVVALETFVEYQVTYTIGSITVFNALSEVPGASAAHFTSVKTLYSGGAPIPPATVEKFETRFGQYIHNAYGMTETTAGVIAVPPGKRAPVDPSSGSLSIGLALPRIRVRTVDKNGDPLPLNTPGELEITGPHVVSGYWRNPEASRDAMPGGRLRTGDVAIIDENGWVYLIDRLKDQINVSGYKVWPREVEDALYEHPAVHEAAVIGQPDDYQGESVVAYVSLRKGAATSEDELVAFARDRLAAYKRPRRVHIVTDLPKTQTGKIRRIGLR